jgi:Mg-chelatase subunit ChlI
MKKSNQRYPFSAIVGQERMKKALMLNVINPRLGGVLIRGEKGTAKSTAVRALASLLPEIEVVEGCACNCDPVGSLCPECAARTEAGELPDTVRRPIGVVDLPVGSTEDRVVGTLDLERAIKKGEKRFEPGLLARANRGMLYVDEVNLLDDHLVDVLLDAAAMGVNTVEREGVSHTHPAEFVLVGTMNPEEGELRPQLLDRFGLCVQVEGVSDVAQRMEIVRRRGAFEADPEEFCRKWREADEVVAGRLVAARALLRSVEVPDAMLRTIVTISLEMGVDGHRADLVMMKTAQALAALDSAKEVGEAHVREAADLALPHRMRRKPFQEVGVDAARLDSVMGN